MIKIFVAATGCSSLRFSSAAKQAAGSISNIYVNVAQVENPIVGQLKINLTLPLFESYAPDFYKLTMTCGNCTQRRLAATSRGATGNLLNSVYSVGTCARYRHSFQSLHWKGALMRSRRPLAAAALSAALCATTVQNMPPQPPVPPEPPSPGQVPPSNQFNDRYGYSGGSSFDNRYYDYGTPPPVILRRRR
jgi:hypothetical protein